MARAAATRGLRFEQAVRIHLLDGIVRRLRPDDPFAIRGSLATRQVVPAFPRVPDDFDAVGDARSLGSDEPEAVVDLLRTRLVEADSSVVRDGVRYLAVRGRGIWRDTDFPGVRLVVKAETLETIERITMDIGFGDPLVPPAPVVAYRPLAEFVPTQTIDARLVHPATLLAWKLHGLHEWTQHSGSWRPKDLFDLDWLCRGGPLAADLLRDAIVAAFESRGDTLDDARAALRPGRFTGQDGAWRRWVEEQGVDPADADVPDVVASRIRAFLVAALA